ncbi:hypothetical protein [Dongia sedimenti]|uniref:Uncharacterized protein n=1 Tax=Dongia sedimenti TaxID=3064282 RepID=A0ABU0YJ10_9PROT|nr:hypothetical protein [Rhodospirillaceae bacterium R-7]
MSGSKEQTWYSNPELGLPALSETRYITFPKDALIAAIKFLAASANQPLPHGKLERCDVRSDPDIAVVLGIRDETTGELNNCEFTAERLGAAMIAYCRQVGVPLPRTAEKSLLVSGDNLMLCVTVRGRSTKLLHHLDAQRFSAKPK